MERNPDGSTNRIFTRSVEWSFIAHLKLAYSLIFTGRNTSAVRLFQHLTFDPKRKIERAFSNKCPLYSATPAHRQDRRSNCVRRIRSGMRWGSFHNATTTTTILIKSLQSRKRKLLILSGHHKNEREREKEFCIGWSLKMDVKNHFKTTYPRAPCNHVQCFGQSQRPQQIILEWHQRDKHCLYNFTCAKSLLREEQTVSPQALAPYLSWVQHGMHNKTKFGTVKNTNVICPNNYRFWFTTTDKQDYFPIST